jgi:hypothetical protein
VINGVKVEIVDTPGFDNPRLTDAEVLTQITDWLGANLGRVTGVLYFHSILNVKVHRSAAQNFVMFRKLVGDDNMGNVGLISTKWDELSTKFGRAVVSFYQAFWLGMGAGLPVGGALLTGIAGGVGNLLFGLD